MIFYDLVNEFLHRNLPWVLVLVLAFDEFVELVVGLFTHLKGYFTGQV